MDGTTELDQILKNTEFENLQQLKAIDSERERIQAYQLRIETNDSESRKLKESTASEDEKAERFRKQHAINKDNIESLKHTSVLLGEHEEALKRKLQCLQEKVEQEELEQVNNVSKYEKIWAIYEAKYDSMEKVQQMKLKKEELRAASEKNNELEARILELKAELKAICAEKKNKKLMIPVIVQIASLRVDTDRNLAKLRSSISTSMRLKEKILQLQLDRAARRSSESVTVEEVDHTQTQGYAAQIKTSLIPLSETTSMPLSCAEPGEGAVQLPYPSITKPPSTSAQSFAPPSISRKQQPGYKRSTATPSNVGIPARPSYTPRFRLELPQFSTFSRKERNIPGGSDQHISTGVSMSTSRSPVPSVVPPVATATQSSRTTSPPMSASGAAILASSQASLVVESPPETMQAHDNMSTQPLKVASGDKESSHFQFKVPTETIRPAYQTTMPSSTNIENQTRSTPTTVVTSSSQNEPMDWNISASSQATVLSSETQAQYSTPSSVAYQIGNSQPQLEVESGGSNLYFTSNSKQRYGVESGVLESRAGRQATPRNNADNSNSHQQYKQQVVEEQQYQILPSESAPDMQQQYSGLNATTANPEQHKDFQYGMEQPREVQFGGEQGPEQHLMVPFGQEVGAGQDQQYGEPVTVGSQGFSQFGSDKSGFNFGGFGQDTGNEFGGGFGGFFGGGSDQTSAGSSSFGAGFSFGGTSQQNTGFSMNFGNSSSDQTTGSSFFTF